MIHSFKVATTLAAQRIVMMVTASANTVKLVDTSVALPIGVTKDTVLDTVNAIPVAVAGEIAHVFFNDTIGAGEMVGSNASGQGILFSPAATSTSISAPAGYLGVLVDAAVSATGTIAKVLIMPGMDRATR